MYVSIQIQPLCILKLVSILIQLSLCSSNYQSGYYSLCILNLVSIPIQLFLCSSKNQTRYCTLSVFSSWYQSWYNSLYSQVIINPDTTLSVFSSWYQSWYNSLCTQVIINPDTVISEFLICIVYIHLEPTLCFSTRELSCVLTLWSKGSSPTNQYFEFYSIHVKLINVFKLNHNTC